MNYTYRGAFDGAPKLLTAFMLSLFLVACGGGTSGDGTTAGTDAGSDAGDAGGVDSGNDDFGDLTGLDDGGVTDDGFTDDGLTDDGFTDGGADFVDANGNGVSDADELIACWNRNGTDEDSSNFLWNDNCHLSQASPFANSTYSQGIQRVLYCSGAAGVASSTAAFADGIFGPNTAEAVRAFQSGENDEVMANQAAGIIETREILDVDGIVGPKTWSRLQSKVEDGVTVSGAFIDNEVGIDGVEYDVFGVRTPALTTVDCSTERNFLGAIGNDELIGSWKLTNTPGGTGINSFGIAQP